jgi:hypothetical protein
MPLRSEKGHVGQLYGRLGPLLLCVLSLNQFKGIGGSDGLAPIGRLGYGRLADSKQFRYGHGRHAQVMDGPMAYKASGVEAVGLFAGFQDLVGFKSGQGCFRFSAAGESG